LSDTTASRDDVARERRPDDAGNDLESVEDEDAENETPVVMTELAV